MSPVENLSPRSKALLVVNEYQQQSMGMPELKGLFQELCADDNEKHAVALEVEEVLRQARYSPTDIWKLLDAIYPERTNVAAGPSINPPHNATPAEHTLPKSVGKRTQPVKSPFIKSFEDFKFDGQPAQSPGQPRPKTIAGSPPGISPAQIPSTTQKQPVKQKTEPQMPPGEKELPALRNTDKTAFFGASLKGISINPVKPQTKARVLVADDDQRIRFVYKTKLEENGYTVIEAENGMEAWRVIQTGEADIAILDMKMPGYHGLDVLGRMVDAGMDMPVIISTAYDQLADEFVIATYPKLQYLVKPIDTNELVAVVDNFVAGQ